MVLNTLDELPLHDASVESIVYQKDQKTLTILFDKEENKCMGLMALRLYPLKQGKFH